jgi:VIT1/CCC1 family predicted Fe2+/Mn2+ transporter
MPQTPHVEKHFTASETVRDIVIGMSDGLTVPFALAAGLSGAVADTGLILTAGFAEIAAGAIAMGLGGYLAARTDAEHYASELAREERETREMPEEEAAEVALVFREYGLPREIVLAAVDALRADQKKWVDFMMRFELGLEKPEPKRARVSATTIALSYVAGGLVPLAPYFFLSVVWQALIGSVAITVLALAVFGYIKGRFTTARPLRSAWQTVLVGGLAAAAAFGIAKLIETKTEPERQAHHPAKWPCVLRQSRFVMRASARGRPRAEARTTNPAQPLSKYGKGPGAVYPSAVSRSLRRRVQISQPHSADISSDTPTSMNTPRIIICRFRSATGLRAGPRSCCTRAPQPSWGSGA